MERLAEYGLISKLFNFDSKKGLSPERFLAHVRAFQTDDYVQQEKGPRSRPRQQAAITHRKGRAYSPDFAYNDYQNDYSYNERPAYQPKANNYSGFMNWEQPAFDTTLVYIPYLYARYPYDQGSMPYSEGR